MLSFPLPQNIKISYTPGYIKIEGPHGYIIKKTNNYTFNRVNSVEGSRLFISGKVNKDKEASVLIYLYQLVKGQLSGYRLRLRLVGIGFRANIFETNSPIKSFIKNYIRKRRQIYIINQQTNQWLIQQLTLKIGYSHISVYPSTLNNISVKVSRPDSRSKGTLILLQSNQLNEVTQVASEIRSFRLPDVYKGKGIYYNREVIKLKKGKRQS